ncbi:tetratricopeptide repeat domain containing protein, putative [Babesia bigemina]|uniref:Tetratricopeptide repeat domain containing protein, putative n=1 Tax=Babesia bigemina TaxID=5866 RepID=A0A061DBA9_BABBI|nr:tetratricopeptide repeat domain containing protein, putative [Babesia bigemina]CDR95030.1 tetratricopeptide repeat domain containing protein, putative [Babesia bigemina]|eukprot:XP_012767216.1 tetratricopeptide repeat domain containing protein, putative [Babesia bigemina]
MDGYVRRERAPLELLDDEPVGECSDAEVDEEELNDFLMGEALSGAEPRQKRRHSFADKYLRKLMRRKQRANKRMVQKSIAIQRKRRRRRTAAHASKLTPQLEKLMQDATTQYLCGNFGDAVKLLKELVRRAPGLHDPFHMLGLIYQEEYKDPVTATGYYLLAAHLVQTDLELWRRIGEMSQQIGNIDQAIYCFKKCLKTSEGEPNEEANFALAMCYLEKNDHHNAIKRLHLLFQIHPDDALLLSELTKSLMAVGDKETLLGVLMTFYRSTGNIDVATSACQLQINLKLYSECVEFVTTVTDALQLDILNVPMDMLVSYAIASLHGDSFPIKELNAIWEAEGVSAHRYYAVANAIANKCQETALKWFKKGYSADDPETVNAMLPEHAIQMARALVMVDKDHETAVGILQTVLAREPTNSQVIILLADILGDAGKHSKADELLARLTTTDLDRLKMIQKPIDAEERVSEIKSLVDAVQSLVLECFSIVHLRPDPCILLVKDGMRDSPGFASIMEEVNLWIDRFVRVVSDCELDTERTYQKLSNDRLIKSHAEEAVSLEYMDVRKEVGKNYSFLKTKKDLGLQSVEDIVGWNGYENLLMYASALMATAGRAREGVQLLEIVANNRKRYKSNTDITERKQLLSTVEELSYHLSCFGGIYKVALVHARGELAKKGSLKRYGMLLATGNLAKAALEPLSSSSEKDALLENRSWIARQLLQKPQNYELLMLAGHYCTMSGKWLFAIEEYKRALIQRPNDSVAALCLATSYFNSLGSKTMECTQHRAKDTKKGLLLGMTFLQYSIKLRTTQTSTHPCHAIFAAECQYNIARAMHFLNLVHMAVPLYEQCINTIRDAEEEFNGIESSDVIECPCVICYMSRRSGHGFPHATSEVTGGKFVWNNERKQILRAAAYNLFLIYTSNKNTAQAAGSRHVAHNAKHEIHFRLNRGILGNFAPINAHSLPQRQARALRSRALVAQAEEAHYVVSNPKTAADWPPKHDHGEPMTLEKCKKIMYDLNALEMHRMRNARKFNVLRLS